MTAGISKLNRDRISTADPQNKKDNPRINVPPTGPQCDSIKCSTVFSANTTRTTSSAQKSANSRAEALRSGPTRSQAAPKDSLMETSKPAPAWSTAEEMAA